MSNVIRPTFGARPKPDAPSPQAAEHRALRVFGEAAGYTVALIQDDDERAGPALKVVIGLTETNEVEAVAILPALPQGESDADVVGLAILRTLEVIEAAGRDPEIA